MKFFCVWTCVVVVFFSASNGQSSEHNSTSLPPPVTDKSESFTSPSVNETSLADDFRNDTVPSNSSAEDFKYPSHASTTTENGQTSNYSTEAPTGPNGTTGDFVDNDDTEEEKQEEAGNISLTTEKNETGSKAASTWGYVILMLILLLIIALCIILFYMRRVSRTYTFDLQRPAPGRGEPIGSFEPVHLDDLDYQVHTSGISKAAEANGAGLSTGDKELNGEVSQITGLQTPDSSPKIEPTQVQLNQDPVNQDPLNQDPLNQDPLNQDPLNQDPLSQDLLNQDLSSSPVLFIEESQEEININNNNPSVRSSAFVEINLDEPQSSVQPFNFSASELQRFS